MERTLKFRRNNAKTGKLVKVNIELTDDDGFRATCNMLGNHGQCFNEAKELGMNNSTFDEVYRFWSLYHFNDMHAGTIEQENALFRANLQDTSSYDDACKYLKSIGLYEVDYCGRSFKYGHGWIKYNIPEDDLEAIKALFTITNYSIEE